MFGIILNEKEYLEAIEYLNKATEKYDKGTPIITDKEWDNTYFEVQKYELNHPNNIASNSPTQVVHFEEVSELKKVKHNHPMLSLAKTKDIKEVESFMGDISCIAMAKMDGLTCSLTYEGGKLVRAETRGNGEVGEDITHNALVIPSIPKRIDNPNHLVIDGEIICDYKTFEIISAEAGYKNPRNYAAGSIRLLDNGECFNRKLTFVAWDVRNPEKEKMHREIGWLSDDLQFLERLNFKIVPFVICANDSNSDFTYDIESAIDIIKERCARLQYPIDGIVFKYNKLKIYDEAGRTDHHFKGGLAYKFYDEEYETRLRDIEWSISRTGQISPIAVFENISIDGTDISKASLSNLSIMKQTLGEHPFVGQELRVSKRNQIIPKIERAKDENGEWII